MELEDISPQKLLDYKYYFFKQTINGDLPICSADMITVKKGGTET